MPKAIRRGCLPAQDVEIAIICTHFVKGIGRTVPPIEYFLDHVLVPVQPKANRPFVRRPTRVAIHFQHHLFHSDAYPLRPPPARLHTSRPENSMQSLDTIHDYLRTHSEEIGNRILSSYPALHGADEAPSPLLSRMARVPYPAQTLAIMGVSKRWQLASNANVVAECGSGKTLIALGSMLVHSAGRPFSGLVMAPPHLVEKWARET